MMENKSLPLAELKKKLDDCFQVNPLIYWADFLLSTAMGYGCFLLGDHAPAFSAAQIIYTIFSAFAFYRAALFIHELTHQDRKTLPGFSIAWNLLVGIPILVPSFMYRGVHIDHHKKNSFGTREDGEYLPLGANPFWKTLAYIAQSIYLPVSLVLRFGVIGPVSMVHPKLRKLVMEYLSALAIRFDVPRRLPQGEDLRNWYILEFLCFLYVLGMAYLFVTGVLGLHTLLHIYLQMVFMFVVNSVRTVVAHRYLHKDEKEMSFQDQLLDSVNIEGNSVIAELVAPVGLRYHGLHHLFPSMPYHSLYEANRRLLQMLPAGSFYHAMQEPSLWSALRTHWKNTHSLKAASSTLEA